MALIEEFGKHKLIITDNECKPGVEFQEPKEAELTANQQEKNNVTKATKRGNK